MSQPPLNRSIDVSEDFEQLGNVHFIATKMVDFDAASGSGRLKWAPHMRMMEQSFSQVSLLFEPLSGECEKLAGTEVNGLPLSMSFVSPRTVRLRISSRPEAQWSERSPM